MCIIVHGGHTISRSADFSEQELCAALVVYFDATERWICERLTEDVIVRYALPNTRATLVWRSTRRIAMTPASANAQGQYLAVDCPLSDLCLGAPHLADFAKFVVHAAKHYDSAYAEVKAVTEYALGHLDGLLR